MSMAAPGGMALSMPGMQGPGKNYGIAKNLI